MDKTWLRGRVRHMTSSASMSTIFSHNVLRRTAISIKRFISEPYDRTEKIVFLFLWNIKPFPRHCKQIRSSLYPTTFLNNVKMRYKGKFTLPWKPAWNLILIQKLWFRYKKCFGCSLGHTICFFIIWSSLYMPEFYSEYLFLYPYYCLLLFI